jgi:hypothetical protein
MQKNKCENNNLSEENNRKKGNIFKSKNFDFILKRNEFIFISDA